MERATPSRNPPSLQVVPNWDQVPSGDLSITMNRITSSTFSRTSTKPFRSCSLDRAHVAAPIPAAVVTNTIWFAFTRTISPSGRCRPSQPVVAAPIGDKTAFPVPPMWQSRANASRLGSINAHASSATTAAAAFVGMFCLSSSNLQHGNAGITIAHPCLCACAMTLTVHPGNGSYEHPGCGRGATTPRQPPRVTYAEICNSCAAQHP